MFLLSHVCVVYTKIACRAVRAYTCGTEKPRKVDRENVKMFKMKQIQNVLDLCMGKSSLTANAY